MCVDSKSTEVLFQTLDGHGQPLSSTKLDPPLWSAKSAKDWAKKVNAHWRIVRRETWVKETVVEESGK